MPTYKAQHTYSIDAAGVAIRWSLTLGPTTKNNPERETCADILSLQVILELTEPAEPRQLDFGF